MRRLFFLVTVAIVVAITAADLGDVSNSLDFDDFGGLIWSDEKPTGQGTRVQHKERQTTDAASGDIIDESDEGVSIGSGASDVKKWMNNVQDDVNSMTRKVGQERMNNVRTEINRRIGTVGQERMNNVRTGVNSMTRNVGQEWLNNVRTGVNSMTRNVGQDGMNNVRTGVNSMTRNVGQEWMNNVRTGVNSMTRNVGQEWMNNVRTGINRRTGNVGQERMSNIAGMFTSHRHGVNRPGNRQSTQVNRYPRQESPCPENFVYNAKLKFCFKVVHERRSTYSAKMKCQQMVSGGRLVQPDTRDKLMELTKYITSNNHGGRPSLAIGARKEGRRDFTWNDGSPMYKAKWCPGFPNTGKPCVRLGSQRGGNDVCMVDGCCYHRGNFICEKPIA